MGARGFKMFCQKGSVFFLLALCVCRGRGGGGGSGSVPLLPNRPPPINKRLIPITKSPKGHYVVYLFLRYFLFTLNLFTFTVVI